MREIRTLTLIMELIMKGREHMAQSNIKVAVQKFGNFLSSMVMPNISAFIAWGLITALFIPTGFFPNENLAQNGRSDGYIFASAINRIYRR